MSQLVSLICCPPPPVLPCFTWASFSSSFVHPLLFDSSVFTFVPLLHDVISQLTVSHDNSLFSHKFKETIYSFHITSVPRDHPLSHTMAFLWFLLYSLSIRCPTLLLMQIEPLHNCNPLNLPQAVAVSSSSWRAHTQFDGPIENYN